VIAAFINLNFVLHISVPLYITISAIYMPLLELIILWQFIHLDDKFCSRLVSRVIFGALLITVVVFSLFWSEIGVQAAGTLMWGAVVLWSIEMLPQIWMNERTQSTGGQAAETISISFIGKTTDFLSMVSLDLPIQFRVMTYFSTCAAYMNIIQFLYFRHYLSLPAMLVVLTASNSVAMVVKVGWELACVITASFLAMLVGGYYLENCLCCIAPESGGEEQEGGAEVAADDAEGVRAGLLSGLSPATTTS
jgi:hypothetical protein